MVNLRGGFDSLLKKLIFFLEGGTAEDLTTFRIWLFICSSIVLGFTLIAYILYLILINTNKNQLLNLGLYGAIKWISAFALFFYLFFSSFSAFRLASTDTDFKFSIENDDLLSNFVCHTKTFSEYTYVIACIYFWITISLTELLGRVFKIMDSTGEKYTGGPFYLTYSCLFIFLFGFLVGMGIYLLGKLIKKTSEAAGADNWVTGKYARKIGKFLYFAGLSSILTCFYLIIPLFTFVSMSNTEDVTVNCNDVESILVRDAINSIGTCSGENITCSLKNTQETCPADCTWIPFNHNVNAETRNGDTSVGAGEGGSGISGETIGFTNLTGGEPVKEGFLGGGEPVKEGFLGGINQLVLDVFQVATETNEEATPGTEEALVQSICDKQILRVDGTANFVVIMYLIFTTILLIGNIILAAKVKNNDMQEVYRRSVSSDYNFPQRLFYSIQYKFFYLISSSFNRVVEEQAEKTNNKYCKTLAF